MQSTGIGADLGRARGLRRQIDAPIRIETFASRSKPRIGNPPDRHSSTSAFNAAFAAPEFLIMRRVRAGVSSSRERR